MSFDDTALKVTVTEVSQKNQILILYALISYENVYNDLN